MRSMLVVGNWKMNGTRSSWNELLSALVSGIKPQSIAGVCVPFVAIPEASELLEDTEINLGSQNVADQEAGAFTGETSASMLVEYGCKLAIVGHSERRQLYGESSELVADRYAQAISHSLKPILCVGETLEQREADKTFDIVAEQLAAVTGKSGVESLAKGIIAYEPVWAIGTGVTASPEQAQEVHAFIRNRIAESDETIAANIQILYGGSVKANNASELFGMPDIDGGLIGGASLDAESFISICQSASSVE